MSDTHPGEGQHEEPNYMAVFYALVILTVVEVLVAFAPQYIPGTKPLVVTSLIFMSLAKAALVAGYFMHLRFDSRKLMIVVCSPIALSAMLWIIPVLETLSSE